MIPAWPISSLLWSLEAKLAMPLTNVSRDHLKTEYLALPLLVITTHLPVFFPGKSKSHLICQKINNRQINCHIKLVVTNVRQNYCNARTLDFSETRYLQKRL